MTDWGFAIAFWILAVVSVGSALAIVLLRNVFRAALFMVLCFVAIAGVFITLNADFLAAVQILIYAGAIGILLIFGIMLTRNSERGSPSGRLRLPALIAAVLLLVTFIYIALNTTWPLSSQPPLEQTTAPIAEALFNRYVLPFEVASVLLLAAIVGAIALVREG